MKKTFVLAISLAMTAGVFMTAARASLLIDDFNDQNTTTPLLMDDGTTYATWYAAGGAVFAFAEVSPGSGNYAARAGVSYTDIGINGSSSSWTTYQTNRRIDPADWPADAYYLEFRIYNLGATTWGGDGSNTVTVGWQHSSQPTQSAGRRTASVSVAFPSIAAGASTLIQIPVSSFSVSGDVLGTANNVMFGGVGMTDVGFTNIYYDDFAITPIPEPGSMALLLGGLLLMRLRRR